MMIRLSRGDMLNTQVDALVNTVNTVGVMGKGIALQFRQAFPGNYKVYARACAAGEVQPGRMLVVETDQFIPRYIINFPTKRHWREKSRLDDIETGLVALVEAVRTYGIQTVAVPPLGCGYGGLSWDDVRPRIEAAFAALPDVEVLLFTPDGAPLVDTMRVATKRPPMTAGRAAIVGLLQRYALTGAKLTMLEIQKLAYFLQCAGEPLKLDFQKHLYGPYTETLHHVLQRIEGHFTRGYGDRSQYAAIGVLPDASNEAGDFLKDHPETLERFHRVLALIEGWSSPRGLELLATVHWLLHDYPELKNNPDAMVAYVHQWNDHKKTFSAPEITEALNHLCAYEWDMVLSE